MRSLLLALCLVCGTSSTAAALVVCADPNDLPFSNRAGQGFENKIVALLAKEMDTKLTYLWWPQRRGFVRKTLNAAKCDLWPGVASGLDRVTVTEPYYRSTYVFVSRRKSAFENLTLDDPRLKQGLIGVQMIGNDATNTPPAHAIANRGIIDNVRGFMIFGDYGRPNPKAAIIDALEDGRIDVALVWGPIAGYFAQTSKVPLRIEPITPAEDPRWPMAFDISFAVRRGDVALRDRLNAALEREKSGVDAILRSYGVPRAREATSIPAMASVAYQVFVTDEKSDDVTIIDGGDHSVLGTIAVGKRPRGIHVSPDGKTVYVAVSGTPVSGPPELDAHGNPILRNDKAADTDADVALDKAADGIAVVDVASKRLTGKIVAGSDPEEFALSKDGTQLYISNEDAKSATVINISDQLVEHTIPVGAEPEGVATAPDGKSFYVTCESGGDVFVVDTSTYGTVAQFQVEGRPRSVAFLPGGNVGFVPSESTGELNVIDPIAHKVIQTLTLPVGSRPMRVRVAPDGQKVYVSNGRAGTISVIDSHSYALLDTIKVGTRPWGIVISPDGKLLYSANGPSNDVSVVDLATDKELTRVKAGAGPWGLVIVASTPNVRHGTDAGAMPVAD